MNRFRLATFDITNTLLKFKSSVGCQYAKTALIYGVKVEAMNINSAFRGQWKAMKSTYPNYGLSKGMTAYQWWTELVKRTFKAAKSTASDEELTAIAQHLYKVYSTKECWDVYPGTHELLEALHKAGLVLGVISNSDERLEGILVETNIKHYFDFVLSSYLVKHEKPSQEIFNTALNRVQHLNIAAKESVHIGDNFELDYLGAKNAGWNAILIHEKGKETDNLTKVNDKHILHNISEVKDFLLGNNRFS